MLSPKDRKAKTVQSEKEGDIAGPNASSSAPFFDIASYCSTFGPRIFLERHICLQYKDTE